ncbi:MAG TPA: tRNA pseudouridine(55) synthase TruB [Candidatus Fimihabitans intestinipullorum]|uniref:tRNA pseudouridine synthase B n=1 Tax=Candidatus Fimihabitans intestinipullorum TaxID=2840820 RepID=A0A9D1L4E4_9BACT|nr:tRNA pseudouridine(55) synthase TruB [Candidatus Fimihabitans intestinipullorum]
MNGVIAINKEKGYTSRDIVNIVGKVYHTKKVGHTGTLDPMATGVLVVCVGKATKLVSLLTATEKEYVADVLLGVETDSLDTDGNVLREENVDCDQTRIDQVLKSMKKTYLQEVPKYSAVKVKGKKLYEYARSNQEVKLPKKEVTIYDLERISDVFYENGKIRFQIRCKVSKGTYIRSLIRDIAHELGTIGVMSGLCRTKQGEFELKDCVSLEQLKEQPTIQSIAHVLSIYPQKVVDGKEEEMILNGRKLSNRYNEKTIVFLNKDHHVLGIYQFDEEEQMMVPWKMILE